MIKRLKIMNFKSYRDTQFEFGKINVVVGPNGSGKTNLVDAFSFLKQLIRLSLIHLILSFDGENTRMPCLCRMRV